MLSALTFTSNLTMYVYNSLLGQSGCSDNGDPENGFRLLPDRIGEGAVVTFGCNVGFNLVGDRQLVCQQGDWSGPWPICSQAVGKPSTKLSLISSPTSSVTKQFHSCKVCDSITICMSSHHYVINIFSNGFILSSYWPLIHLLSHVIS